jgi:hypothetical protein
MATEMSDKDMNKALFINLVMMLGSTAMQQLGKLVSPVSGKPEMDLEGAQITIDMLNMIAEKTKNNLEPDEVKALQEIISSAQMNYVETINAEETKATTQAKPADGTKAEQAAPTA